MVVLEPGSTFAQEFTVVRLIGQGGMGSVYEVVHRPTGAKRALKLMAPLNNRDPNAQERFLREARVCSLIKSPYIVDVMQAAIDATSGVSFLVMELLEGETLTSFVERNGPLAPEIAYPLLEQLFHAISAAHAAGIVHRDIKPDNIFLSNAPDSRTPKKIKVLDFGIAKILQESRGKMTVAAGTPLWMAPEQTEAGDKISPPTDVWALGLVAYYSLCGLPYWRMAAIQDSSTAALMREILFEPLDPPSIRSQRTRGAIPLGFDSWFFCCVNRDIRMRHIDAAIAWQSLAPLLARPSFPPNSPSSIPQPSNHYAYYAPTVQASAPNVASPNYPGAANQPRISNAPQTVPDLATLKSVPAQSHGIPLATPLPPPISATEKAIGHIGYPLLPTPSRRSKSRAPVVFLILSILALAAIAIAYFINPTLFSFFVPPQASASYSATAISSSSSPPVSSQSAPSTPPSSLPPSTSAQEKSPPPPTIRICLKINPPDAIVERNGSTITTPCIEAIKGESISLTITKSGFTKQTKDIVATSDTEITIDLKASPLLCPSGTIAKGGECLPLNQSLGTPR